MYDVNSKHADDFINHQEILETLAYADANKNNRELIEALIDKAALRKGLSHREASVLLVCEEEDLNQKIYKLAEQIKKISTETGSSCSRRCTFPTTASTAAPTVPTI